MLLVNLAKWISVVNIILCTANNCHPRHPTWIDIGGSCIMVYNILSTWKTAKQNCHNEGSRLLIITDDETYKNFNNTLLSNNLLFNYSGYWSGHAAYQKRCCISTKKSDQRNNVTHKTSSFCVIWKNKTAYSWIIEADNSNRAYICQIEKEKKETTKQNPNELSNDGAHVSKTDIILMPVIVTCAAITIIASALGVICIYRFKIKKQTKNSSAPKSQKIKPINEKRNTQGSQEDVTAYVTISDNDLTLNNKPTASETSIYDGIQAAPVQAPLSKNDGRYITEEGLVYVTVSHVKSINSRTAEKPNSCQDEIEYATVIKRVT
ncbi:hypothetical protein Btru_041098 [Bulinus truncatus]|nr:hypothetical protein Btru_041098 [Bulinus truncatus]